ncbi:15-hydroxyprostaglandin dehydrogenase [NAD(+)]-like [Betta splendens]|uniref:15-hydroxyprostaglandin dehydrogenase [NAD(+)] n=1 Tax=Betta splendens TaxID=158456 RepID=A0A6P7PTK4_BETSP|nr:15-hydroxyprostaglandin dehydrogenase [NAD(+)]-like [Betta splendens]
MKDLDTHARTHHHHSPCYFARSSVLGDRLSAFQHSSYPTTEILVFAPKMALNGKVAVVTGAAMGIGKAITERFLQSSAKVVLLDMNETAAKSLMQELVAQHGDDRLLFLSCNVACDDQMKAAFQKVTETFGGIDIVCNNAGILDECDWEKTVSVNLGGVIRGTYVALEHMNKLTGGRGGVVINTASVAGVFPVKLCPVYTASKHGVVGFTRAMAAASSASGYGVRFNAICPGTVQTQFFSKSRLLQPIDPSETLTGAEVFGKITPCDVAESVLELVMDETRTGEALMILQRGRTFITFPQV